MIYREEITEQMQRQWWASIDNERNHYTLILYQDRPVGMGHLKNLDLGTMTGEGGMIIWDLQAQSSIIPFLAAAAGNDWSFSNGIRRITCHVLTSNKRAIRYNKKLGTIFDGEEANGTIKTGYLTAETYYAAIDPLRPYLEQAGCEALDHVQAAIDV